MKGFFIPGMKTHEFANTHSHPHCFSAFPLAIFAYFKSVQGKSLDLPPNFFHIPDLWGSFITNFQNSESSKTF